MALLLLLRQRRFLLAVGPAVVLSTLVIGIPTDLLPNPWFKRMTPVRELDLILWPLTSLAIGALLATAALPRERSSARLGSAGAGGLLSVLAVGCPVCNKLVVAVLGISGALTYFAPLQPILGVSGLAVALFALRRRMAAFGAGCPLPLAASPEAPITDFT